MLIDSLLPLLYFIKFTSKSNAIYKGNKIAAKSVHKFIINPHNIYSISSGNKGNQFLLLYA